MKALHTLPVKGVFMSTPQDFCQRLVDMLSAKTGVAWSFGYGKGG